MTAEVGALSNVRISQVFMTPLNAVLGAFHGTFRPASAPICKEVAGLDGVFGKTSNLFAAERVRSASTLTVLNANYGATRGLPIGDKLSSMSKAFSALGPRGMIVGAAVAVLGGLSIAYGAKLARHASNLIATGIRSGGDIPDGMNSSTFHGARILSGLGLISGGILCLIPGGAALGLPMLATSGVTTAGLGIARWSQQPDNFINCPNIMLNNPVTMPLAMVGRAFNDSSV